VALDLRPTIFRPNTSRLIKNKSGQTIGPADPLPEFLALFWHPLAPHLATINHSQASRMIQQKET
jgi:hypothetical protein